MDRPLRVSLLAPAGFTRPAVERCSQAYCHAGERALQAYPDSWHEKDGLGGRLA